MSDMTFSLVMHAVQRKLTFNSTAADGAWWLHRVKVFMERATSTLP